MKIYRILIALAILNMTTNCENHRELDIQGHRGARGLMPENTLPAFKKAIELGVTTLELDLAISKDHKVVVSHEPYMNHVICTDANGKIISETNEKEFNLYQLNYDSIKQFDCGLKGHPRFPDQLKIETYKPLLSEVFDLAETLSENKIFYNIEIKSQPEYDGIFSPSINEFVSLVLDEIRKRDVVNRTTLQSFDLRAMEEIKKQAPEIDTALLVDENEVIETKLNELTYKPSIVSPYYGLLNQESVQRLQNQGFKVIPWTINDVYEMERLVKMKVDGIITDYPDRLIELMPSR